MDVFMPFIQRTPGTPVEQDPRQVLPVFKEARLEPLKRNEQKFLILRRFAKNAQSDDYPPAPYTTPEEDQHVDKDGHVDIFI